MLAWSGSNQDGQSSTGCVRDPNIPSSLPILFFTEGGGGRPGDTEGLHNIGMDVYTFTQFSKLSGRVPLVGLNSGMMIPQYTTAALVSENKSLCFPSSADSIPTSLGQEDHVSMGSISGRKFMQVLGNLEKILAIEILMASQALEFRRPLRFSEKIEENLGLVRQNVAPLEEDRLLKPDIDALIHLVRTRQFTI